MYLSKMIPNVKCKVPARVYSLGEEIASSVTHGIGFGLAVAALVVLIVRAVHHSDAQSVVSVSIYGSTLILLYLMSTLYHALTNSKAKKILKILDHSSIYLLIAGTYTVYSLSVLRGALGWVVFGVIWGCAILGIVMESLQRNNNKIISTILFVLMGWVVIGFVGPMKVAMSSTSFALLLWGGGVYTLGAIVYALKRIPWTHPVWHLFVIAGSILHFFSIWWTF
ncbi:MAG TPA: hemolysin III family protein [Fibrobacteraceae bacterium]|nr:hemolysin III family protein [Fibrobacteraceae bacterium]